jgi:hypothetical protein
VVTHTHTHSLSLSSLSHDDDDDEFTFALASLSAPFREGDSACVQYRSECVIGSRFGRSSHRNPSLQKLASISALL